MMSILTEWAYGNVNPQTQYFDKKSKFGQAMAAVSNTEEKLLARLGAEDRELFIKYVEAQAEVSSLTAVKNMTWGFKCGLTMTAEAFVTAGDLVTGEEE